MSRVELAILMNRQKTFYDKEEKSFLVEHLVKLQG